MNRLFIIMLLSFFWAGLTAAHGSERTRRPHIPELVNFRMDATAKIEPGSPFEVTGVVGSLIGTQTEVMVSFDASPNLKVEAKPELFPTLGEKEEKALPVKASWVGEPPKKMDSMNTWVRMTIEYSPDYPALSAFIKNEKNFPEPSIRQKLLRQAEEMAATKKRKTVNLRFFPDVANLVTK